MKVHPNTKEAYDLFHKGILALSRAEQQGIRIDMNYAERKKKQLTRKIERLEQELQQTNFYKHWSHAVGGKINIYSPQQLAGYLYKVKKLTPIHTTKSGQGSTDDEALKKLNIPELNDLLRIKKLKKIRDTYLEGFIREQVNGYIHTFFNLHLVQTFRSSSDSPNFQNIPKRDKQAMTICRKALFPRPGHQLMEVDYSGVEFRIAGCYYKDPTMLKYIHDPKSDIHGDMAAKSYLIDNFNRSNPKHKVLRSAGKNGFVFPELYGSWYKNCARNLACEWGGLSEKRNWKPNQGISLGLKETLSSHLIDKGINNLNKFQNHIKTVEDYFWNDIFKTGKNWQKQFWKNYQRKGYIDSLTGFRYKGVMSLNNVLNYPIQGAAFHCLLWSFIEIDRIMQEEGWNSRLIGQIHDAILFDIDPAELQYVSKIIKRVTCEDLPKAWTWINVPLDVEADLGEVDASWADLKPYEL